MSDATTSPFSARKPSHSPRRYKLRRTTARATSRPTCAAVGALTCPPRSGGRGQPDRLTIEMRVPSVVLSENIVQLGFLGLVASWSVLPGLPMDSSDAAKWCARRS